MKEEGKPIPANVQKMLDAGAKSFTKSTTGSSSISTLLPSNTCRWPISPA